MRIRLWLAAAGFVISLIIVVIVVAHTSGAWRSVSYVGQVVTVPQRWTRREGPGHSVEYWSADQQMEVRLTPAESGPPFVVSPRATMLPTPQKGVEEWQQKVTQGRHEYWVMQGVMKQGHRYWGLLIRVPFREKPLAETILGSWQMTGTA